MEVDQIDVDEYDYIFNNKRLHVVRELDSIPGSSSENNPIQLIRCDTINTVEKA